MAMRIAEAAEQRRRFEWITRKGTKSQMPLPNGWLTVSESLKLPEPDTSWMSNPLKRPRFHGLDHRFVNKEEGDGLPCRSLG